MVFVLTIGLTAMAQKKVPHTTRAAYVLKNLGVNKEVRAKLQPLLLNYLKDKNVAGSEYDKLKERLKSRIKMGNLTEQQAQQLLDAKWKAAERELAVKKAYEKKFKTVLSVKKTYACFSLLNDKKSKILGKNDDDF